MKECRKGSEEKPAKPGGLWKLKVNESPNGVRDTRLERCREINTDI